MNITVSTTKSDYLNRVAAGLADLPEEDRQEVIQDLRAHLGELDDTEVEETLGSPEDFVAEFRTSAGLDAPARRNLGARITHVRSRLETYGLQLAEITRWHSVRPVWIWTRGWLLVSIIAVHAYDTAFRRFPIPTIEYETTAGLALVLVATWLSLWLDRKKTPVWEASSFVYSSVVVVMLLVSLTSVVDLSQRDVEQEAFYPENLLMAPDGMPVHNLYAYDLDGNPIEVLLFDQEGRPLLSLPPWVYEEAESNPGFAEPLDYGHGAVEFQRDDLGRIIPNLYPLDLYDYGPYGLEQATPPQLGFPGSNTSAEGSSATTTSLPPAG